MKRVIQIILLIFSIFIFVVIIKYTRSALLN